MSHSSKRVIYAAAVANFVIAIFKFIGAALTGSSAMFSEGIHSLVDTGNQGLLLLGMKMSNKPPDKQHPFGYGREMYFWSFVVAIAIFGLGSGVALYEGGHKIFHPGTLSRDTFEMFGFEIGFQYIVLAILFGAMIVEGKSWWIAYQEFKEDAGEKGIFKGIRDAKDPVVAVVLVEDTAAMIGLFVAFVGVSCSYIYDNPLIDAWATVGIGLVLAVVSAFLAIECKSLLIGEAASEELIDGVTQIASALNEVKHVNEVITYHVGPQDVVVCMSLDFSNISADDVEAAVSLIEKQAKEKFSDITRMFVEAQNRTAHERDAVTEAQDFQDR